MSLLVRFIFALGVSVVRWPRCSTCTSSRLVTGSAEGASKCLASLDANKVACAWPLYRIFPSARSAVACDRDQPVR